MRYHCARCHFVLTAPAGKDGDGGELHCPRCKAEAGLEPQAKAPLAMMLFSAVLVGALVASATFGALTLASGAG